MAVITRAQMQRELVPGLKAIWGMEQSRYSNQWKEIFDEDTSERSFEEVLNVVGFGPAEFKSEGKSVAYDTTQEFYVSRYVHQTVALAFSITEEAMEDNLYVKVAQRNTKALAYSFNYTKEVTGAAVLNNAFTSGFTGGDGVTLASTSHPLVNGGTISNRPTTGVDLNETAIENAVIQMSRWTDSRGLLIQARPKKLIIPPDYAFTAERLLSTVLRVGTADNDINAVKSMSIFPGGYTINPFLTDTNAWFIKTDQMDGLTYFSRVKLSFDKDGDFETGNFRFKGRERYSFGWSNPLSIWASPGVS